MSMELGAAAAVQSPKRRKRTTVQETIALIRGAIAQGATSIDELVEHTDRKPATVENFCYRAGISLKGFSSGGHEREKRRRDPQGVYSSLVSVLKGRCIQLAYQEGWAQGKAEEVIQSQRRTPAERRYTPAQFVEFFSAYEQAAREGEKLSVYDLCKLTEIHPQAGDKLLARFGLRPLAPRMPTPKPADPVRIVQAYDLGLGQTDIAYFARLTKTRVRTILLAADRGNETRVIKRFNIAGTRTLTYSLASQIYEAEDAGYFTAFSANDIEQLFDTKRQVVTYTREHRIALEPLIIQALHTLHPERTFLHPYLYEPAALQKHATQLPKYLPDMHATGEPRELSE